jgi:hypothetical protein
VNEERGVEPEDWGREKRRLAEERRGEERLCTTHDEAHALQAPGAKPQATGAMKPFKLLLSQMSIVLQNNRRIMMNLNKVFFRLQADKVQTRLRQHWRPSLAGAQGGHWPSAWKLGESEY